MDSHSHLTPRFVAEALHLLPPPIRPGGLNEKFTLVTSDSRKVVRGCLFVALKGDVHDGHEFVASAIEKGARGVLVKKGALNPSSAPSREDLCVFSVEDTLVAYRKLASAWRKEFSIPMIAVAGSVGKTTTKELLSAALLGKWESILKTQGSQNGFVGIPMTLLELREDHRAAVIEVGIDEIGAMAEHMQLVNANFAILSTIGPEHLEKLRDVPTVAHEEGIALSTVAQSGGTIVVNLDDPWIRPHFKLLKAVRKIGYTLSSEHRFGEGFVLSGTLGKEGAMLKVSGKDFASTEFALPLLGEHNARNLLGAIAMAHALGLTPGEISKGLRTFKGAAGRSEIQELPRKTPVVCDYYNANPTSVEAGLDLLTQISGTGRGKSRSRWACLADMLELGPNEERFHRELSKKITTLKIENVFLYGPRMKALEDELKKDDFKGRLAHFNSHGEMVAALRAFSPGDALLIKGSRGMKMEKVWEPFKLYAESTWTPK